MSSFYLAIPIYIKNKFFREKNTRKVKILNKEKVSFRKTIIFFEELEDGFFVKEYDKKSWNKGDKRFVEEDKWKFIPLLKKEIDEIT